MPRHTTGSGMLLVMQAAHGSLQAIRCAKIYPSAARAGLEGEQVDNYWQLVPDELPPMTYTPTEAGVVVRSDAPGAERFPRSLLPSRPIATCMCCWIARR